jgi:hypothetical protein
LDDGSYPADRPITAESADLPAERSADLDDESERLRSTMLGLLGLLAIAAVLCIGLVITVAFEALVRIIVSAHSSASFLPAL